jgi:hypothetical protein
VIPARQRRGRALLRRLTGAEPVETHISAVFVGRDDAFKLKKAVRCLPRLRPWPSAERLAGASWS